MGRANAGVGLVHYQSIPPNQGSPVTCPTAIMESDFDYPTYGQIIIV